MDNRTRQASVPLSPLNFDDALGRQIVELHIWVVREGLRGGAAAAMKSDVEKTIGTRVAAAFEDVFAETASNARRKILQGA